MILPLAKLQPGMHVARNVSNINGTLLLAAGTALSAHHLHVLKVWGVQAVHVEDQSEQPAELPITPALRQAAEAHVNDRLRHASASPSFEVWKELAICRTATRWANEPPSAALAPGSEMPRKGGPVPPTRAAAATPATRRRAASSAADFVREIATLPSLPSLYYELVQNTQNGDASVNIVSGIIRKDQGLVSRLLRLANSVFYGLPLEVDSPEDAVQIIGFNEVQNLVLATSIIKAFDKMPSDQLDVSSFWLHSIACATASSMLAEQWYDPLPERFFVGGLLHDSGRLLMLLNAPEESREILSRCQAEGALAMDIERQVLGFDHVALGAELASNWKLPHSLREMVRCHHNPAAAAAHPKDAFFISYADFIVSVLEFGKSGEVFPYPLRVQPELEPFLLDPEQIPLVVDELEAQCAQLFPILTA